LREVIVPEEVLLLIQGMNYIKESGLKETDKLFNITPRMAREVIWGEGLGLTL